MEQRNDLMLRLFEWSLREGLGARVKGIGVKFKRIFFFVPDRVKKNEKC